MNLKSSTFVIVYAWLLCFSPFSASKDANPMHHIQSIIDAIEKHEGNNEPKCYATASRLEDFMFGTPLSDNARFAKNRMQQQWVRKVWQSAAQLTLKQGRTVVGKADIEAAVKPLFKLSVDESGHHQVTFNSIGRVKIHRDDKRQYGSVSYSLRAVLAVQQAQLLEGDEQWLPLHDEAIKALTDKLDLLMLSVLKVADNQARQDSRFEIAQNDLEAVWKTLTQYSKPAQAQALAKVTQLSDLAMLKSMVEQKVRSYAKYNKVSQVLFQRNLQVYFARNRWPKDEEKAREFRQLFTETVIAFSADLYLGAQQVALSKGHNVITEADVSEFTQKIIPHRINEYEDAIFFHHLEPEQRVTIESYDMDAFRDSGIHWRYLQFAVTDKNFKAYLEPDPFAAELIVENIAQMGVLVLRMTGKVGRDLGDERIKPEHFVKAVEFIQQSVIAHGKAQPAKETSQPKPILSATTKTDKHGAPFFTEVTQASGIDFMHRTSNWLNRLLRGFITRKDGTGVVTVPPAFGGAGVATEDINNDGLMDILILSGLGNRLYVNRGEGKFEDISKSSGIDWRRPDNHAGEPRQPLIADLDNDGLQDIVITYVNDNHRVYKNLGNERFSDVTDKANLAGSGLVGGPATVFDYDNDGLLDIYITYFGNYLDGVLPTLKRRNSNGQANRLYRNLGGFKFEETTKTSGLDNTGWGQAVTHVDFDGDGIQDVIVGNDFGVNGYYKNLGDGRFKNVAFEMGVDKPSYTMGIGSSDLNGDGRPDIYISNIVTMNKDEKYVLPNAETQMKFNPKKLAKMRVVEGNDLFISTDKGGYQLSQAVGRGYSSTGWSWDADFFDFDNDGDDDLYVLNGINEFNVYSNENPYYTDPLSNEAKNIYIPVDSKESNVFFVNQDGKLNNASKQSGVDFVGNSRSAAYFDLEGDGDLDMIVNDYHGKARLYRNNSEQRTNHWLKVKLVGAPKQGVNLDAIGAQVILTTEQGQYTWRMVQGSTGYMSVHPKEMHFGLNDQSQANLEVIWPNGKRSKIDKVQSDQLLIIDYADSI